MTTLIIPVVWEEVGSGWYLRSYGISDNEPCRFEIAEIEMGSDYKWYITMLDSFIKTDELGRRTSYNEIETAKKIVELALGIQPQKTVTAQIEIGDSLIQ